MNRNELRTRVRNCPYPQEPLYSNFPWFNCMARSVREKENEKELRHRHQILTLLRKFSPIQDFS